MQLLYRILSMATNSSNSNSNIVFVSGHHPKKTYFAIKTRATFEKYTQKHGYGFYYDEDAPTEEDSNIRALHYRRCVSIRKAATLYPTAKWFVWVDSDVYLSLIHI